MRLFFIFGCCLLAVYLVDQRYGGGQFSQAFGNTFQGSSFDPR
jgi:hypothetical protein